LKYFTLETHVMSDESDEEKKKVKVKDESKGKSDYTKLRMCRFC